jgi:hypothetical protein
LIGQTRQARHSSGAAAAQVTESEPQFACSRCFQISPANMK